MASASKTDNLGLNQWEASDAVQMDDFNADNLAIDAAVGRKAEFVKLKTVSFTPGSETQLDVDVSGVDLSEWQYLIIDVTVSTKSGVRINNIKSNRCHSHFASSTVIMDRIAEASSGTRIFFSLRSGKIMALAIGMEIFSLGYCNQYVDKLSTVNFFIDSDSKFSGRTEFIVWGLK